MRIGRPRRFDQARPFVVLGAAFAAWLVLPVAVKRIARASFFEMSAPVTVAASYVSDLQRFWALRTHTKDELITAGRDLARVNARYEVSVQRNDELEAQVERLKNLLQMPPTEKYRLEHAEVAQRDFSGWWQRMVIRKGNDYGIPVGAPVVYSGGVVGRISEVHAFTAVVQLISDPGFRIAAVVDGDTRPISYQGGENQAFGAPRGVVEFLPLDIYAGAKEPKRLATSGLGGVYPPGLTIGQIIHVEPSQDGLFKTGEVELDTRLSDLTEVTVMVPLGAGIADMRGTAVLFLTLYLLHALVGEANNMLSGAHVWLFAGGLFVTYAALEMPFRGGFAAAVLGGLLCDAAAPVAFGTHAGLFAIAHVVIFNARARLQRQHTPVRVAVAALANLGLFLAVTFIRLRSPQGGTAEWPRLMSDLAWSEAAVAAAAPWFFSLQLRSLQLARAVPWRLA